MKFTCLSLSLAITLCSVLDKPAQASEAGFLKLCKDVQSLPDTQRSTVQSLIRLGSGTFVVDMKPCDEVLKNLKLQTRIALHGETFEYFTVEDLAPLAELDWLTEVDVTSQSGVTTLAPLASLPLLRSLKIVGTRAPLEELAALPNLTNLELEASTFTDLQPITLLSKLESLNIQPDDSIYLGQLGNTPALRSLKISIFPRGKIGAKIQGLNKLEKIETFQAEEVEVDLATLANLPLQTLEVREGTATNIPAIAALKNLEQLTLTNQKIESIEFLRPLKSLQSLNLGRNQITDAEVLTEMTTLRSLDLSQNQLWNDAPIRGLTELRLLNLSSNRFTTAASIGKLTKLENLDLSSNALYGVETDPASVFQALKILRLEQNDLRNAYIQLLDGTHFPALEELSLANNKITRVETFATLLSLQNLNLDDNKITGGLQALKPLTSLKRLSARYNLLSDLACPIQPATVCDLLYQEI